MSELQISLVEQYLKELSFKQKHMVYDQDKATFDINVNTSSNPIEENNYESIIEVEINLIFNNKNILTIDLTYVGVFTILNASKDELEILLNKECPRLIFPFIREMVSKISRESGMKEILLNTQVF